MRGETGPDYIEALARGLDVIRAFGPNRPTMTLSEVAAAASLARPTARRILLTLEELGYVRASGGTYALTSRVLAPVVRLGVQERRRQLAVEAVARRIPRARDGERCAGGRRDRHRDRERLLRERRPVKWNENRPVHRAPRVQCR